MLVKRTKHHPEDYQVHYLWPATEVESADIWVGGSPWVVWNDQELSFFRAGLTAWMKRTEEWKEANALMMEYLAARTDVTSSGLLNACRWFEEIPLAQPEKVMTKDDLSSICAAALQVAESLGYSALKKRISGALSAIRLESNEEKYSRLLRLVKERFDLTVVDDDIINQLKKATNLRGKIAHGHYSIESDADFESFMKSSTAMNAFCFLLTLHDLPISEDGLGSVEIQDSRISKSVIQAPKGVCHGSICSDGCTVGEDGAAVFRQAYGSGPQRQ